MKLSSRLIIAMVGLVALTVTTVSLLSHRSLVNALVPRELDRMRFNCIQVAMNLTQVTRVAINDLLAVQATPPIGAIIGELEANPPMKSEDDRRIWEERLATIFRGHLLANPHYLQFRFIGVADEGREIVRVERTAGDAAIVITPKENLQRKGARPYFIDTLKVPPGNVYITPIELNREFGEIQTPHIPVQRVATPVFKPDGEPFGILIINVDMSESFEAIRQSKSPDFSMFVLDANGDYLIHPNKDREFQFELGVEPPSRFQDDYPHLAALLKTGEPTSKLVETRDGNLLGVATAFVRVPDGPTLSVVETVPFSVIIEAVSSTLRWNLYFGVMAGLVAVLIAIFLARSLAKPLDQITRAVVAFSSGIPKDVPTEAPGEIGVLATAFQDMATDIRAKTEALEDEIGFRKSVELKLESALEKERLLGAVVKSTDDAVSTMDLDGTITSWNPAAERVYGYSAREMIGQSIRTLVPENLLDEEDEILTNVRKGETITQLETVRRHKSGREFDASLTVSPVRDSKRNIVGASTIARDITEQKRIQKLFRQAVESSPNGIVISDSKGKIKLANSETNRLFRYSEGELLDQQIEVLVPDQLRKSHALDREKYLLDPGKRMMGEGRNLFGKRKDGSEFPVEIGLTPIMTSEGVLVLSVIVDITRRQKAEKAILEYTKELEKSNAELEQFAYVASHDLQEPLRMVASYTELLGDRYRGKLDERADKYIHYATDGANRMKQLVNDLLKYSRVGTQGKPLTPTDSKDILERVLLDLKPRIEDTDAEIQVGELPIVNADPIQLGQLFQNLIGNALKFRGPNPPLVEVQAMEGEDFWTFSVTDNGIGIEEGQAERVFQMFQRLHERERYEGSGVGLAIAKKIVERHGGRIWYESDALTGTTFSFTFPKID